MKFKFCPNCSNKIAHNKDYLKCPNCEFLYYFHSSGTGSVFLIKDNKVLLAKRKDEPQKGKWDIVGGFLQYGEHPLAGTIREVKEETNLKVKNLEVLGVYTDKYSYQGHTVPTLNIIYVGQIAGGKLKVSDDVAQVKWFDINKDIENLAFPTVEQGLKDLRAWHKKHGRGSRN